MLRDDDDNFGIVPKAMKENRIIRKRRSWRNSLAVWMIILDFPSLALMSFLNILSAYSPSIVLNENGMFKKIMYQAALFSEMLWDSEADYKELVRDVTVREYVEFL